MNERIRELAQQAGVDFGSVTQDYFGEWFPAITSTEKIDLEKFAQLIVEDHAKKTIQGLMSDPAFVQAMDEYYENKWAHRFD